MGRGSYLTAERKHPAEARAFCRVIGCTAERLLGRGTTRTKQTGDPFAGSSRSAYGVVILKLSKTTVL
jgi:hypothetical protein